MRNKLSCHYPVILFTLFLVPVATHAADRVNLSLPLNCEVHTCYLQSYVDMDPSSNKSDPFCGTATYNNHKGTDIRVRSLPEMKAGIPVLAMADGVVLRGRDGMTDRLMRTSKDRVRIKGRECGNGVVIDHGKGWVSQTCHLAKGSLIVKSGQKVRRGQAIAKMGLSGATQFPHVHVTVRYNDKLIDPVSGNRPGSKCLTTGKLPITSLWDTAAREFFKARSTSLLEAGYASGPVKGSHILASDIDKPTRAGPLVFYAHFINLKKDDQIELVVHNGSKIFAKSMTKPLAKPKATYTVYTGKRGAVARDSTFKATAKLIRNDKVLITSGPYVIEF